MIQIPVADSRPEGTVAFTFNKNDMWKLGTLTVSPFNWMEASYFYYRPSDLRWEVNNVRGDYLDKGFNVKLIYRSRKSNIPNVALGLDDFAGTGFFTREYIVATNQFNDTKLTAGIGWGKFAGKNSFENPHKTWKSNLIGTVNLLEVLKNYKKKKVVSVFITSDKVYKNFETSRAYKESDQLGGVDPYSASKSSADLAIQSYINSFNFNNSAHSVISIARAGNVIGGADWSDGRLIPDCVRAWSKNKKVIIRNLNSTRPWQHVLEVLSGYLKLAASGYYDKKLNGEIFNFGPNTKNKYKVKDILEQSKFFWDKANWAVSKKNKKFKESKLLHLNSEKARKKLSWNNLLSLKETLSLTIDWYKKYYEKKTSIEKISKSQIEFYQKKLKGV